MKPKVFIGSSVESKYIADAIQANLEYVAWCTIWEHAFPASQMTIDTIIREASKSDFAVFIFSEDDILKYRKNDLITTRDNVVFESGLFMGMLGRDRVFIVKPRDVNDFHILTDLSGFTTITYESERAKRRPETKAALTTPANEIEAAISNSFWNLYKLKITLKTLFSTKPDIIYPSKVEFKIQNDNHFPVTIQSIDFRLNSNLKFSPKSSDHQHKPLFLQIQKDEKHKYVDQITIEKNTAALSCWIPMDISIDQKVLDKAILDKKIGTWTYRNILIRESVVACNYEENF